MGQYTGVIVSVNDQTVFAILTGDLDYESNETLKVAADRATAQLRVALEARAQQRNVAMLVRGIALSIAATLVLLFALWLVIRIARRIKARFAQTADAGAQRMGLAGLEFQPVLHSLNRTLAKLTAWAAAVALTYRWLTFVLLRFPYTQPWGQQLGTFLISIFATIGTGILYSIPGMFTVVVIFLLTRIIVQLVSGVFQQVEKGDLTLPCRVELAATAVCSSFIPRTPVTASFVRQDHMHSFSLGPPVAEISPLIR